MNYAMSSVVTTFMIGFAILAAVGVVAMLAATTTFFSENRAVRVRRHEGLFNYYGHLALGR